MHPAEETQTNAASETDSGSGKVASAPIKEPSQAETGNRFDASAGRPYLRPVSPTRCYPPPDGLASRGTFPREVASGDAQLGIGTGTGSCRAFYDCWNIGDRRV